MSEPGEWTLSDLKSLIETSTAADGHIISTLRKIADMMEKEQMSNFILGKVIITNDLSDDEDEEEDE